MISQELVGPGQKRTDEHETIRLDARAINPRSRAERASGTLRLLAKNSPKGFFVEWQIDQRIDLDPDS